MKARALLVVGAFALVGPASAEATPWLQVVPAQTSTTTLPGLGVPTPAPATSTASVAATQTSSTSWLPPPAPPPPTQVPLPAMPAPTLRPDIAFRLQGGLTGGTLLTSGGGLALTAVARWSRLQVEVGGRYHFPRNVRFADPTQVLTADLSMFELDGRACAVLDRGAVKVPVCAGLSGGRWAAEPDAASGANPSAQFWAGGHVLLSVSWEIVRHVALWAGAQGTVGLVMPEVVADSGAILTPDRFGLAFEGGVEIRL